MSDSLKPVQHGGNILAVADSLGCPIEELIDMSSNLTPLGMVPGLRQELTCRLAEIAFLPETASESVCRCFAERYGLPASQVLAGNGTTEFIFGIPQALTPRRGVIVNPTYGDYHLACGWAGVKIIDFSLDPEQGFKLDLDRLAAVLDSGDLVFLCNPNNPTGAMISSVVLHDFFKAHADCMFLVDESYLPFVRDKSLLEFESLENLLVLSSYSKIYGIPGLRLGFLTASSRVMARLGERRKPWGVNCMAQIAGEYVCRHGDTYVDQVRGFVEKERPRLVSSLQKLPGIRVIDGAANFILSQLTGKIRAPFLREKLLEQRIMIRNCANFNGLDESYFRISLKEPDKNSLCLKILREILGSSGPE